jgi:hypothetical protein
MKRTTAYVSAAIICVLVVWFWLSGKAPDDDMPAERPAARKTLPNGGIPVDEEVSTSRERQHQKSKYAISTGNLMARARETAIQGILDGNADLIRQAIGMAPNDPFLLFIGATHSLLTTEEHLEFGKRFHEQDPDNALAAFMHASHLLKAGDSAAALEVLRSSRTCADYSDYINETGRLMETALTRAGHSSVEAKSMAFSKLEAGYYIDLRDAVGSLVQMAGDLPADEAASMRSLASYMSRRISDESKSGTIIRQMVGLVMEKSVLEGMTDDQPSPYDGLTVAEARESIEAQCQKLRDLTKHVPDYEQLLRDNPQVLELYLERMIRDGEVEALKWLRDTRR